MSYPTLSTPGSSAVGLTASINKDPVTKDNFALKILKKKHIFNFFGGKTYSNSIQMAFLFGGFVLRTNCVHHGVGSDMSLLADESVKLVAMSVPSMSPCPKLTARSKK